MLRRLLTRLLAIIPAVIVIWIYGENEVDSLLIFSQVVLSMQLGFAVIPLIHFVSDKYKMGDLQSNLVSRWRHGSLHLYWFILMVRLLFNEAHGLLCNF